jgi:biotin carboxyl carrier protein
LSGAKRNRSIWELGVISSQDSRRQLAAVFVMLAAIELQVLLLALKPYTNASKRCSAKKPFQFNRPMSYQIKIPSVGESVVSALVARWHIADGARVEKGQVLVTLETDKISNELEAEVAGKISIAIHEGEEVEIGTVIGLIDEAAADEVVPVSEPAPSPTETPPAETL